MKKTLRMVAIISGAISLLSAVILGCFYLETALGYIQKIKDLPFIRKKG